MGGPEGNRILRHVQHTGVGNRMKRAINTRTLETGRDHVKVIDMHGRHGAVPEGTVYVGRGQRYSWAKGTDVEHESPFKNPFTEKQAGSRERAVEMFREYITGRPELIERARRELRGRDLACWCAPEPCHGDVLLELANEWHD
jgi:hypothetical protein